MNLAPRKTFFPSLGLNGRGIESMAYADSRSNNSKIRETFQTCISPFMSCDNHKKKLSETLHSWLRYEALEPRNLQVFLDID